MQAVVWRGAKDVRVRECPRPSLLQTTDAIVRVTHAGICGSDLHLYHHAVPDMHTGDILGHEIVGVVEEVGSEVHNLKPGERVSVAAVVACGSCWYCQRELFSLCESTNQNKKMERAYGHHIAGALGHSGLGGGYQGGQAEFLRVPYADIGCMPLPIGITDEQGVLLADSACTGWMAAELGEVAIGKTVAVWGCGPIGLLTLAAARIKGAERLFAIDLLDHRLQAAVQYCGAEVIHAERQDPAETLLQLTDGNGPDVCIDAVGFRYAHAPMHKIERAVKLESDSCDVLTQAVRAVRKGGNLVLIGDYIGLTNHFPIGAVMEKGLTVRGGQVHAQRYRKVLAGLILEGAYEPSFVVSHRMPLSRAEEAYALFDKKADNVLKIILYCGENAAVPA